MNSASRSFPTATLYVGDLHPDVTESMLLERFSPIGRIESVRVCTDKTTGRSLGYAYVNFCNPQDAEKTFDTMNYEAINGCPMRIMWSQKEPTLRKSGVGNIFIKNLDKTIDSKVLYDTFSIFGNIVSSKLAIDEEGNSKGYGFVHFETEEVAKKAIMKVNGMLFNGKKVYVGKFIPRSEREKMLGRKPVCPVNLYVKNFNDDLDEDKLKKMFEKYGEIKSVKVILTEDGKSKGFGFVCFEDSESAKSAIDELNNKEVDGKILYVGRAQKKAERQDELRRRFEALKAELSNKSKGANLYVKNLDEVFDDERLKNEFSPFGTVKCAKVMRDSDNRSRGFGFVCFNSPDEASEALKEMHKRIVVSKPLYVAYAQRKEDRRAYIESQFLQKMQKMHTQSHFRQSFQPGNASYYRPNMPQSRCYIPPQMPQMRLSSYSTPQPILVQ